MAKTVIEDYVIQHKGKTHTFKNLGDTFIFCDKHRILYPARLWEKEPQPHIKKVFPFAYDVRNNRERLERETIEHQYENRILFF